jgi:hypothetical protein
MATSRQGLHPTLVHRRRTRGRPDLNLSAARRRLAATGVSIPHWICLTVYPPDEVALSTGAPEQFGSTRDMS